MNNKLLELTNNNLIRSQKKQEENFGSKKKQFFTPLKNVKKRTNFKPQSFSENLKEKRFGTPYDNNSYDVK